VIRLLGFFIALLLSTACWAQKSTVGKVEDLRTFTDGFMGLVVSGKYDEAFQRARTIAVVTPAEVDAMLAQLRSQLPSVTSRVGKPMTFEHVRDQVAGASLIRSQYISKHERAPMRWNFVFFKTSSGWVLLEFRFDGNISALFPGEA